MKRHIASVLIAASCFAAAYVLGGSGASTEIITSATLTINVGQAHFMEIHNFTQVGGSGQRGTVVVGIFATPTPTVTPVPTPTPTLSTNAGPGVALSTGEKLTDTATLFGDNSPTGTITFTLRDPSNTPVYIDTLTVTGNNTYTTAAGNNPGGFRPTATGTYTWSALYSGDSNNNAATDNGQNETEIVTSTATPAPTPTPTPAPIVGTVLSATIIDSGGRQEPIKPIIIQGPAQITVAPVPSATLSITYRKFAEPTPTPTPTVAPITTATATPSPTPTATPMAATIISSTILTGDVSDEATPTATPITSVPVATSTPASTATPSITPTPTPTATP